MKEKKDNPKARSRKEIIIRAHMNRIKNKNTIENRKPKACSLKVAI